MPISTGSRISTQEAGAGSWVALRTLTNQVAETGAPPAATVTGVVDLTAYVYPGAFVATNITIDTVTFAFVGAAVPANEVDLLAGLNGAFPGYTWDIDIVGGRFLRVTKNVPGNFAIAGTLLPVAGIAAGTYGPWVDLGLEYPLLEVSYENLVAANAPDNVLLHVWRLIGTKDDVVGTVNIPSADLAVWRAERVQFDARYAAVTVGFQGGAVPDLTGTVQVRYARAGESTLGQSAGAATELTLAALNAKVTTCDTANVTVVACALPPDAATETTLAAIDGKITVCDTSAVEIAATINLPVVGPGAVGAPPAANPLDLAAEVLNADPGAPLTDGHLARLRTDSYRRLIVTDPNASPIATGADADHAAVTSNPVLVGGVHQADPTASPLHSGDVGQLLINELRMLIQESRTFDASSDADKTIPVWNPTDLWTPEDLSGTRGSDGTTSYYVALEENRKWSLQFIPTEAAAEVITVTVWQSNEDLADITARTYTNVTQTFFGTTGFVDETWIEPEHITQAKSLRFDVTVTGWTAGTSAWDGFFMKGSNS